MRFSIFPRQALSSDPNERAALQSSRSSLFRLVPSLGVLALSALLSACQPLTVKPSGGDEWPMPDTTSSTTRMPSRPAVDQAALLLGQSARPRPALADDLWQRMRAGFAIPSLGGKAGERLAQNQAWYLRNGPHLQRTFTRARLYLFDIVEQVEASGLPLEVALLPAVESAFIAHAHSSAAADGLWQFISPTGRRFNLKQHMFQDDRRNVRAATLAAIRYLKELQQRYNGDMQLALAAYNCGEGCIDKHVRRAQAQGLAGRFEDLTLNEETANYVPRLLALTQLIAQGVDQRTLADLNFPAMDNAPYYAAVPIARDIDVKLAAQLAGMRLEDFRTLNAQHKKPVIVAAANAEVLVPVARADAFRAALDNHRGALASLTTAHVAQRMSLDQLARQHGTNAATLRNLNGIAPGYLVSANSTILVPRQHAGQDIPAQVAESAKLGTVAAMQPAQVGVMRKEGWAALAGRLSVSVAQLQGWNPGKKIKAGVMSLTLPIDLAERAPQLSPISLANRKPAHALPDQQVSRLAEKSNQASRVKNASRHEPKDDKRLAQAGKALKQAKLEKAEKLEKGGKTADRASSPEKLTANRAIPVKRKAG